MEKRKLTKKDEQFGKQLKRLRQQRNVTQQELAEKTNLSLTFIGLLETGKRRASLKSLQKIANVLGIKVNELIPF